MTKLRWNDPPKEHDPAHHKADCDPNIRFVGPNDGDATSKRQDIINRLIEIGDLLTIFSRSSEHQPRDDAGFLSGDDLKDFNMMNDFDPSLDDGSLAEAERPSSAAISSLMSEKVELEAQLRSMPREDSF